MRLLLLTVLLVLPSSVVGQGYLHPVHTGEGDPMMSPGDARAVPESAAYLPLDGERELGGYPVAATITRATSAWCPDSTGQITEAAAGYACFDGADRTTNYAVHSQRLHSWSLVNATVTQDIITAPDGTLTADSLDEDGTASTTHRAYISHQYVTPGNPNSWSIYVKAGARTWARLYATTDNKYANVNLSTCALGAYDATSASVSDQGGGWCRVSFVFPPTVSSQAVTLYACEADNDCNFSGLSQVSLYAWGAQVSPGSSPGACACPSFGTSCTCTSGGGALSVAGASTNYVGDTLDLTTWLVPSRHQWDSA